VAVRDPDFARWLLASLGSGLVAIDAEGAVVAWSAGASRLLAPGREPRAVLGVSCDEALAGQPVLARLLRDAALGREVPTRAELVLAGDAPRTIGFTVVPVLDPAGVRRGAGLWFRDLTPYERMDEQARLRERLAALGQMAAGLAHELRNPLAGMEVLAGLLRRRLADRPRELELLDELCGELRTLAATVTASLDFVRPLAPSRRPLDPVKLLEACLETARARVPFGGEVERAYAGELPALAADEERLRPALTDLLVNALEAMAACPRPCGHRLRIGLAAQPAAPAVLRVGGGADAARAPAGSRPERELVVAISDTGPGVAEDLRERIFYPFFTTKPGGSGVGLANAQKVVASHGGAIELETRAGEGATFRVRLPLGDA
jgi:signal transduction histidine kinase